MDKDRTLGARLYEAIQGRLHDGLGTPELPTRSREQDHLFRRVYQPLQERFEPLRDRLAARLSGAAAEWEETAPGSPRNDNVR
jgi:hypothetical protein